MSVDGNNTTSVEREVDLTTEEAEGALPEEAPVFELSPLERRERTRERLALILVLVLAGLVIVSVIAALLAHDDPERLGQLKDILSMILGPIVGLVGAVTGFYFGEQSRSPSG